MNLAKILIYQAGSSTLAVRKFDVGLCHVFHKQSTIFAAFCGSNFNYTFHTRSFLTRPIRLDLFQSYLTPSGHSPSRTESTPKRPHTSKSGPTIVTNRSIVLALAIANSRLANSCLSILYISFLQILVRDDRFELPTSNESNWHSTN